MRFNPDQLTKQNSTRNTVLNTVFSVLSVFLFFIGYSGQVKTGTPTPDEKKLTSISTQLPKMVKKQGIYAHITHTGPHTNILTSISAIIEGRKGNIWATTTGEGVYCYNVNSQKMIMYWLTCNRINI